MTTNSRLQFLNLRQKKNLDQPALILPSENNNNQGLKLHLPDTIYEPTYPANNMRPPMRLLKGKLDRNSSKQKISGTQGNNNTTSIKSTNNTFQMDSVFKPKQENEMIENKLEVNQFGNKRILQENMNETKTKTFKPPLPSNPLKLVLPDQDDTKQKEKEKKLISFQMNPNTSKQGFNKKMFIENEHKEQQQHKRILIKQPEKNQKTQNAVKSKIEQKKVQQKKQIINQDKPIQQILAQKKNQPEQLKQELIQNQNDLVECTEGCGRKFNRKALQTHAKACKIVFMSKRKQFNSQAKRVTSKQQANLVKQAKQKQKKDLGSTKMQKTGQAWKTQSQGFRAVIKALKQQQVKQQQDESKPITCQYCQKIFTDIIYEKHIQICQVKKQKEKEKEKKAKKNTKK